MYCPQCGSENKVEGARFCKSCGTPLPAAQQEQPAEAPQATVPLNAGQAPASAPTPAAGNVPGATPPAQVGMNRSRLIIIIIAVAVVAVVAIFAVGTCSGGKSDSTTSTSSSASSASAQSASSASAASSDAGSTSSAGQSGSSASGATAQGSSGSSASGSGSGSTATQGSSSTSGSIIDVVNQNSGYTFKSKSSYYVEYEGQDTHVYTGSTKGAVPYFRLTIMQNSTGRSADDLVEGSMSATMDRLQNRIARPPERSSYKPSNRSALPGYTYAYSTEDGSKTLYAESFSEDVNGFFFTWSCVYEKGDTETPEAMRQSIETIEFLTR